MTSHPLPDDGTPGLEARIRQAALRRFERFGFRRTSVGEIARDVGVAAGTLYRYFRNKQDIFLRALDAENERWLEAAREAVASPGTALDRITRLAAASVIDESNRSCMA